MPEKIQIKKGDRYGKLTLTWRDEFRREWSRNDRVRYVECVCDCGNIFRTRLSSLRGWKTATCWCRLYKHWMCNTRIYKSYTNAKDRCENPKNYKYKDYWWRWIKFLRSNFEEFYADMGVEYEQHVKEHWEKNTTIDRIDVNWNYCKENCRRATKKEQSRNKRNNISFTFEWKEYSSISEFCEVTWQNAHTISTRINRDWMTIEEAITIEVWSIEPKWKQVKYKWKIYPSISALCREVWMNKNTVFVRMFREGMSLEDAIETPINEKTKNITKALDKKTTNNA